MVKLINGDCLIENQQIESGSVDLILTDLPYGTMKGAGLDGWKNQTTEWDMAIEPKKIFDIANRILRKNGKLVLFSQEPYTTKLITESIPNIPFNYRAIWEKDNFANALLCNKAMVGMYEDILVFSKSNPVNECEFLNPLREYFKSVYGFINLNKKQIIGEVGQCADHTFRINSTQYDLCTRETYHKLIEVFNINQMQGYKPYSELKNINNNFSQQYSNTFNLWQGGKYKSNILKYTKNYDGYHPTQKPLALLEDLIKTFSNEGDLVVDLTMGSGSTPVACIDTGRDCIGIEKEEKYYKISQERCRLMKIDKASRLF